MKHLDLLLLHDPIMRMDEGYSIEKELQQFSQAQGFTFELMAQGESYLHKSIQSRSLFPEGALVYVHGGYTDRHRNFDRILSVSPRRTDLRWIVEFDSLCHKLNFNSDQAYEAYRGLPLLSGIEKGDDPLIIAHPREDRHFFPTIEEGSAMADYILNLLEVRK